MLAHALLVTHIAVLGYWLGAELVINHTYRYVCWSAGMPFPERQRLMEHVMDVDQHVRYALALQVGLGTAVGALLGYFPGGGTLATVALGAAAVWLGLIEVVHRTRHQPRGPALAALDRVIRYGLGVVLLGLAGAILAGAVDLPGWLGLKLGLLAGAVACGLGIRWALVIFFREFRQAATGDPAAEPRIRQAYVRATAILVGLWVFLAGIAWVSVTKPAL
jgi:hypothetical protein